jgi:hypothetical protein
MNIVTRGSLIGATVGVLAIATLGMFGLFDVAILVCGFALTFLIVLTLAAMEFIGLNIGGNGSAFVVIVVTVVLLFAFLGGLLGIFVAAFRRVRDMG